MSKSNFARPTPSTRRCHRKCACWRGGSRDSQTLISTQVAKAEEEARKKRAAALAEAEAAAKKKLADEAQALAKAHAEAAAKEKAAAEKRKAEEEKVCSSVRTPFLCPPPRRRRDVVSTSPR